MTWLLILWSALASAPAPAALSGRVTDAKGKPIADARVDIWTAKPKVGIGTTCPSCYRDCARWTKTAADGRFEVAGLDPALLFRVTVMAPGRRAIVTDFLDPGEQDFSYKLSELPQNLPQDRVLEGRVVDENGAAVAGALVTPTGARTTSKRWWGSMPGVDAACITDEDGRFVVTSSEPKLGMDLEVEAPGFAIQPGVLYALNGQRHEIRLQRGAHVAGRLTVDGKPRPGRALGIVQRNRSPGRFVGEVTISTDGDGQFQIVNLQPNESYVLYSLCSAGDDEQVLQTLSVETGENNSTKEVGELKLNKGFTLGGRIVLPKGTTMPANAKLHFSRDPAWDWRDVQLNDDGRFSVRGLPAEVLTVTVSARGFKLDSTRLRFQTVGNNQFALRLRQDRNDVLIWLIPDEKP